MQQFLSFLRILSPVAALTLALTTGGARLGAQTQSAGLGAETVQNTDQDGTLQFHKLSDAPPTAQSNHPTEQQMSPDTANNGFWRSFLTESWRIAAQHAISGIGSGAPGGGSAPGGDRFTESGSASPRMGGASGGGSNSPSAAPGGRGEAPSSSGGAWSMASQLSRSLAGQQGGGAAGFALRSLANVDQLLHGGLSLPVDFGSAASSIKLNYQNDFGMNQHGASTGQLNASYHTGHKVDFAAAAGLGFGGRSSSAGAGATSFGGASTPAGASDGHAGMAMGLSGTSGGQSGPGGGGAAGGSAPGQGANSFSRPGQGGKFTPSVSLHLNF